MIRLARNEDINEIMEIIKETVEDLISVGDYQWSDEYPNKEVFLKDIEKNELFVCKLNDEVAGVICLNSEENIEYKPLNWRRNDSFIVIHRFAVKRKYQRQKVGTQLIQFSEEFAKSNKITYIKVDTNSKNIRMIAFFNKHGFHFIDEITMRDLEDPFYCYDKILE